MSTKKEIKAMDRAIIVSRALSGEVTQQDAADKLGISDRQVRRVIRAYRSMGSTCFIDKRGGSKPKYTKAFKEQVLSVVRSKYHDFGPTFALEKLKELHDIQVSREYLRQWMMEAKIWSGKKRKTRTLHQSRQRRAQFGELIQLDGSHHDWFEGRAPKCCLLVLIDDATSRIVQARFEEAETTLGYFRCMHQYLTHSGRPLAVYSDRYGVFSVNVADKISGLYGVTQFQRAMRELNIEAILANSPQAKGRVERANSTLQDRLIKEMRLKGISSREAGNDYLPEFIQKHNEKYAQAPLDIQDAHRKLSISNEELNHILSFQEERVLTKQLEFGYENKIYQIKRSGTGYSFRGARVVVCEHTDGAVTVVKDRKALTYSVISKDLHKVVVADRKEVNALLDKRAFKLAA
jgi:transposase